MVRSQKLGHGFGLDAGESSSLAWAKGDLTVEGFGVGECHMREGLICL
jgi:hypothetical protein